MMTWLLSSSVPTAFFYIFYLQYVSVHNQFSLRIYIYYITAQSGYITDCLFYQYCSPGYLTSILYLIFILCYVSEF